MSDFFTTHRPTVSGTQWLITTDHPLAAAAGAAVLEAGGNAMDAAVAANLVMAVVRPHMCGLGGDLFALVHRAEDNLFTALNASGRAPAAASVDVYRDRGLKEVPDTGLLAATVPGALVGWRELLDRFGTKSLDSLLGRAIGYAENGFPMYGELAAAMAERQAELSACPAAAEVFLPHGRPPDIGSRLIQADLAASLRLVADNGPAALYSGPLGQALVRFSDQNNGLFTADDLAAHSVDWHAPLTTTYRDFTIATQPPSSQGIALLMQADMLENADIAALEPGSAELVHLMVEVKKLAFADRDAYICDPAFHPVPVDRMLDKAAATANLARIDPQQATQTRTPHRFTSGGEDTIYLAVVDGQGNAVSLIQSLYEYFGSCTMVPGTGITLHNRAQGFSLDPNHPNRIEGHKRPYHTLHPAMILKDGLPWTVLGSPGADGQTQTVIQMATDLIDFHADPQQTVAAPRWRSNPDGTLLIEGRFPAETLDRLTAWGHRLNVQPDYAPVMGSAQAIQIDRKNNILSGGADPRRQAYAIAK